MITEPTFEEMVEETARRIYPLAEVCGISKRDLAGLFFLAETSGFSPFDTETALRAILLAYQKWHWLTFWQWLEIVYAIDRIWHLFCRLRRRPVWGWRWHFRIAGVYGARLLYFVTDVRKDSRRWLEIYTDTLAGEGYRLTIERATLLEYAE